MNGTCMENAKFRRQAMSMHKNRGRNKEKLKKEEMKEEWKKWKNSDELKRRNKKFFLI